MRFVEVVSATALLSTLGAAAPVAKTPEKRSEFAPWYRGMFPSLHSKSHDDQLF